MKNIPRRISGVFFLTSAGRTPIIAVILLEEEIWENLRKNLQSRREIG